MIKSGIKNQCCGQVTDWAIQCGFKQCQRRTNDPSGFCHTCRPRRKRYWNPWLEAYAVPGGLVKNDPDKPRNA